LELTALEVSASGKRIANPGASPGNHPVSVDGSKLENMSRAKAQGVAVKRLIVLRSLD
jgi:hypothetical protein